jgi:hypothetical protein
VTVGQDADQGIVALDARTGRVLWRHGVEADHVHPSPTDCRRLICRAHYRRLAMSQSILILDIITGAVIAEHPYPQLWATTWTAVAEVPTGLLLGGYAFGRTVYVLALLDPAAGKILRTAEVAINDLFSQEVVDRALELGDCCGFDLCGIPAILPKGSGNWAVVVLGGDVQIGPGDAGGCAIGLFDTSRFVFDGVSVLQAGAGATAALLATDGAIVLNCDESILVARLTQ